MAAVTDASIASRWDAPAQPRIPFHTSETAEGGAAGGRQLRTYSKKKKKKNPPSCIPAVRPRKAAPFFPRYQSGCGAFCLLCCFFLLNILFSQFGCPEKRPTLLCFAFNGASCLFTPILLAQCGLAPSVISRAEAVSFVFPLSLFLHLFSSGKKKN